MRKLNLTWNVFLYDSNTMQPVTYNIFDNHWVYEDTPKLLNRCRDEEEFKEEFRKLLAWQFKGRYEYEILVSPVLTSERHKTYKLDVYEQCMLNFDRLTEYVWLSHLVKQATKGFKKYATKTEKEKEKK